LRKVLEQSKELGFLYTRLDEILGWPHRRLTEVEKEKIIAVKGTISLSNLGELHALMERTLDRG